MSPRPRFALRPFDSRYGAPMQVLFATFRSVIEHLFTPIRVCSDAFPDLVDVVNVARS